MMTPTGLKRSIKDTKELRKSSDMMSKLLAQRKEELSVARLVQESI